MILQSLLVRLVGVPDMADEQCEQEVHDHDQIVPRSLTVFTFAARPSW
jgi:hypothetical protein